MNTIEIHAPKGKLEAYRIILVCRKHGSEIVTDNIIHLSSEEVIPKQVSLSTVKTIVMLKKLA